MCVCVCDPSDCYEGKHMYTHRILDTRTQHQNEAVYTDYSALFCRSSTLFSHEAAYVEDNFRLYLIWCWLSRRVSSFSITSEILLALQTGYSMQDL